MPAQMWFGNERRMQWVPAPATGMQASNIGTVESMTLDNGRASVKRSMQTHKVFPVEFPVQDASQATGLDVFNRYASGLYGSVNEYPLFFADPMHYDQNLFPANWAAPGLFKYGWASIAPRTPRTYYNFAQNPSVEVAATWYSAVAGTGGTASGARFNAGSSAASGQHVYRVTWSVATSAVSGGINYIDTPINANQPYGYRGYVRANKIQRVQITMRYRNAADADVGNAVSSQVVLAANTLTLIEIAQNTAPATATTVDIEVRAVTGTSGANWAASDWLQLDGQLIYEGTAGDRGSYFDGDTSGAAWLGTRHASVSVIYVSTPAVTISSTAANSYDLPPDQATFDIVAAPNAYPTHNMAQGDVPYALIPIPPGYTLWLGASGSATGTAVVRVHAFNSPGNPASPALSNTLTLLSSTGAVRLNASYSGSSYQYVKVFLQRTSSVASTITLSAMMAQLWPTGYTPPLSTTGGNFIAGQGHRGLKFADDAIVESYVMANRHLKGLSTTLIEAQDRG